MPLYDFRCRTCDVTFELRRSMSDADQPAACPEGHVGAVRLLPVFAATGRANGSDAPAPSAPMTGGCGGACACHGG